MSVSTRRAWWSEPSGPPWVTAVEDGSYRYTEAPSWADTASFVHVTHPQFLAGAVAIEPGREEAPPLTLTPASPVRVRVVDEVGAPVGGAVVSCTGWVDVESEAMPVRREYDTDDDGIAVVSPLPNDSFLEARVGELRSSVWHGRHAETKEEVVLVLRSTFSASGTVVGARERSAYAGCSVLVRFLPRPEEWNEREDLWPPVLAAIDVADDGSWENHDVPWVGAGTYVLRFQGDGTSPMEVLRTVDRPATAVRADFEWPAGHGVEFRAVDTFGEPLEDILLVMLRRDEEDRWVRSALRSDSEGRAVFEGCQEARYFVRASGEGIARQAFGPYHVPADIVDYFRIELQPAAVVRGRCEHRGEPIPDFDVTFWGDDPTGRFTSSFTGCEDGRFEIRDGPPDVVHLFATTRELPASAIVTVSAPGEQDGTEEIVLALPDGFPASGRVIDASTGEPVAGATLQVYPRFHNRALDPWGAVVTTDSTGAFSGLALSPHRNAIEVKAEGYERRFVVEDEPGGPTVDLSIVALSRMQRVVIELVAQRTVDFSAYSAMLDSKGPLPFGADGRLVFEGIAPGYRSLGVFTPGGDNRIDNTLLVRPGDEGPYRISVATPRTIVATLDVKPGVELPSPVWLAVSHHDLDGGMSRFYAPFDDDGRASTDMAVGDSVMLSVVPYDGIPLATRWVRPAGEGVVHVELPVAGERHHFLFQDAAGTPLNSALAIFRSPGDEARTEIRLGTDEKGRLALADVFAETLLLRVSVDVHRKTRTREVHLTESSPEDPIVIVADIESRLRARLSERGHPATGVAVELFEPGAAYVMLPGTSDDDGLVEIPYLSAGEYLLRPTGAGYWPRFTPVVASEDPDPTPIEVRRIGTARLQVTQGGAPVVGARIEIVSSEEGVPVSEWIEQGLARVDGGELVTDQQGELVVAGLPNGPYAWSVARPDGAPWQGTFTVPPHALAPVEIALD